MTGPAHPVIIDATMLTFRRRILVLIAALLPLAAACSSGVPGAPSDGSILLLISLDGYRADYRASIRMPALDAVAQRGVSAEGLIPVFPAKTFPNHHTIVTGLYPEHHGIVSNTMDDPAIRQRFMIAAPTTRDPRWWGGEPLWATANRQGRRTAAMFWPGSDVPINGSLPTYWIPYDESVPNQDRVAQVLEWLALPEAARPSFITLYFSEFDEAGHDSGPESREIQRAANRLDRQLTSLFEGITKLGLDSRVILALVSDHGMSQLSPERVIFLDDYLDPSMADVIDWSPVLALRPRETSVDDVVNALKDKHPSLAVYKREEMPENLRYRDHPRIPPVVAIASEGWTITTHERFERQRDRLTGGEHGYLPSEPAMHGLFVAAGPGLRQGVTVPAFQNVHLYELFCALLGIEPAANDGDPAVTRTMLAN